MTGTLRLSDPELGDLDLTCANGYNVLSVDLGTAQIRPVARSKALYDGTDDNTRFLGARAVTISGTYMQNVADPQTLEDQLMAYQSPRRRPTLLWSMPGSGQIRSMQGLSPRGMPAGFSQPKYIGWSAQWVCPSGKIVDPLPLCLSVTPSSDTELGRVYPEDYTDGGRGPYPPSAGTGGRIVTNAGTRDADWTAQLFGPCVNPTIRINGITVTVTITLVAGESIVIDTASRTILRNGDPTQSKMSVTNFTTWSWASLLLPPGENTVRISATSGTITGLFCFSSMWQ